MDSRLKEEFLTCIICHEVFRDPVTLHCGHTICSQCVTAFTKTQHQAVAEQCIPCPHCRALTKVPDPQQPVEQWAGQIKTGFFVKGLVETFVPKENVETMCSPCAEDGDKTTASVWCSDCDKAMCKECHKFHRRLLSSHSVSDLTDKTTQSTEKTDKKTMCEDHKDTAVDMMCQKCDIAVCPRCCIETHTDCIKSVVKLTEALPKIKSVLEKRDVGLQENIDVLEKEIPLLESHVEKLQASSQENEIAIDSLGQTVVTTLKETLHGMKANDMNHLQDKLSRARTSLQIAKQNQEVVKEVLRSASEMAHYEVYKTCPREDNIGQSTTPVVVGYKLKQNIQPADLQALGVIKPVFDEDQLIANSSKAEMVNSISVALQSDTCSPQLYDVKVLETKDSSTIIVTDPMNSCVKSFQYFANKTNKYHLQFTKSPYNLTLISDVRAAVTVTDLNQIVIFDFTPELAKVKTITTKKSYFGLSYFPELQFVVSDELDSVDIIDMSGVILRSLCPGSFTKTGRVCVIDTHLILVTEVEDKCVRAISDLGESIFVFKQNSLKPRGVAKSTTDEYFVVDSNARKVLQFSEKGEFVRDVLTSKDGLEKPSGLFVDRKNKMYVVTDTGYIQVFAFY